MKITQIVIFTLVLFISTMTSGQVSSSSQDTAQKTTTKGKNIGFRKQKRILAKKQINQLKDGSLLVRLQTKENSIAALRKIGKDKLAVKVETKQRNYNIGIISAFKTNFNFCPTYFFFSDYSQNIIERQVYKVAFLSDSLLADNTIKFNNQKFLTAEFGTIEQDTAEYFSHSSYESDGNGSLKRVENYHGRPHMDFAALTIKSDQLIQLRRPFKYYTRTFDKLPIKRSLNKTVKRMNKKLNKFYNKINK